MNFEIVMKPIGDIKINPNNPRIIKDDKFKKLVKSIQEFPEMLNIRPIVCNAAMIVLGGNMRLKACIEAGLKEVPVIMADNLTEEQQREFIIKDNVSGGEWDWEQLANEWDSEFISDWGLDVPAIGIVSLKKKETDDFLDEFEKTTDESCAYPIVPSFFEKHECFVIPCHNSIDVNFLRDIFGLNKNFVSSSGDGKIRRTNVISVEAVRECFVKL